MDAIPDLPAYTVLENGYIHGTWFCGRPTTKYYGSFPKSFWPRAKHVLRPWGSMVHWFSGLIPPEPGIVTVDGNRETNPSVVSVGPVLPFPDGASILVLRTRLTRRQTRNVTGSPTSLRRKSWANSRV